MNDGAQGTSLPNARRWGAVGHQSVVSLMLLWVLTLAIPLCQATTPESNLVAVDFENVDLRIFIKFVSETTGRVFLLDDRVRGQVSVRFTNKIPLDQLPDVLESVLELKGFAAIPAGPITKIVPLATAKQRGIEVRGSGSPMTGDRR
jgi:type II secretory pathway component GspD/PulD (secretin)